MASTGIMKRNLGPAVIYPNVARRKPFSKLRITHPKINKIRLIFVKDIIS